MQTGEVVDHTMELMRIALRLNMFEYGIGEVLKSRSPWRFLVSRLEMRFIFLLLDRVVPLRNDLASVLIMIPLYNTYFWHF